MIDFPKVFELSESEAHALLVAIQSHLKLYDIICPIVKEYGAGEFLSGKVMEVFEELRKRLKNHLETEKNESMPFGVDDIPQYAGWCAHCKDDIVLMRPTGLGTYYYKCRSCQRQSPSKECMVMTKDEPANREEKPIPDHQLCSCGFGAFKIDYSIILTSNPPMYKGRCNACDNIKYFTQAEANGCVEVSEFDEEDVPLFEDETAMGDIRTMEEELKELREYKEKTEKDLKDILNDVQDMPREYKKMGPLSMLYYLIKDYNFYRAKFYEYPVDLT